MQICKGHFLTEGYKKNFFENVHLYAHKCGGQKIFYTLTFTKILNNFNKRVK